MSDLYSIILPALALLTAGVTGYAWGRKDGFDAGSYAGFKRGIETVSK